MMWLGIGGSIEAHGGGGGGVPAPELASKRGLPGGSYSNLILEGYIGIS